MFKKIPKTKKEKTKVVKIVTEEMEHICTEECFKTKKSKKPTGLLRVDLGYVYHDRDGKCYCEAGKNDWLEITGITFAIGPGGLHIMYEPKQQLHIHSRGGRTIARTTEQRNARVGAKFHAEEATKKLKRKGNNRKDAQTFFLSEIQKVIPKAPKRKKPIKGTGRGGAGVPRTPLTKEIVRLIGKDKSKPQVLSEIILWAKTQKMDIAGPHMNNIKKQVNRWWIAIKSAHK